MGATGTATLDFGAAPGGCYTSVAVTGQTGIAADSLAEAWIMADSTADHNASNHSVIARYVSLVTGSVVAGTGFTIEAVSDLTITGTVKVRWVWS